MLKWYVYRQDFNTKEIEKFNVFEHGRFRYDVQRLLDGDEDQWTYTHGETFSEKLKHIVMYYFWSKCEYEVVITSWPPYVEQEEVLRLTNEYAENRYHKYNVCLPVGEKIDVYDQLMLNWDAFVRYIQEAKE